MDVGPEPRVAAVQRNRMEYTHIPVYYMKLVKNFFKYTRLHYLIARKHKVGNKYKLVNLGVETTQLCSATGTRQHKVVAEFIG